MIKQPNKKISVVSQPNYHQNHSQSISNNSHNYHSGSSGKKNQITNNLGRKSPTKNSP